MSQFRWSTVFTAALMASLVGCTSAILAPPGNQDTEDTETNDTGDTEDTLDTEDTEDPFDTEDVIDTEDTWDTIDTLDTDIFGDTDVQDTDVVDTGLNNPNPYATFEGHEEYVFGVNDFGGTGDRDCSVYWATEGVPHPYTCDNCAFTFDVTYTYEAGLSENNQTQDAYCQGLQAYYGVDMAYTLALNLDYNGLPNLGTVEAGVWYPWAVAVFNNDSLTYSTVDESEYDNYYGAYPEWEAQFLSYGYEGQASLGL